MIVDIQEESVHHPVPSRPTFTRTALGYSRANKDESHRRIVDFAATRLREAGLEAVSIAQLMKEAGLTHGGFYRHFNSRDDLVREALEWAFAASAARVAKLEAGADSPAIDSMIDAYLSKTHRDAPGEGCAMAALACE